MALGIIGELIGEGVGFFRDRQKLKHETKSQQIANRADWETRALETAGWKDEFWTVVLGLPLIVIFIGTLFGMDDIVARMNAALQALQETPIWYQSAIGIAIGSAFGVKGYKVYRAGREKDAKRNGGTTVVNNNR